ncbi:MAG TPA: Vps62-related protein [Thermoanaerobaculia bacterium]
MANPIFSASGMDFQFVSSFSEVWNTSNDHYGSAAGSFWDAQVDDDSFKPFGTLCVPQTNDPSGQSYMLVARNTRGNSGTPGALPPLAPPSGFTQVWNDHGTGNTGGDGACWQIVPPDGYVALGTVFNNNNYNSPDPSHYWCIRADLVTQLGVGTAIWNDQGTGATTANMQCYGVGSIGSPSTSSSPGDQTPVGSWAFDPGSFLTGTAYTVPTSLLNVIVLPSVGQLIASPGGAPQLTPNVAVAPASENTLVASMDVLFPMITDSAKQLDWQIAHPVYTIEIWGQWTNVVSATMGTSGGSISQQIQSGIEQQAIESWDNQLGVTVSVSAEAEVGFLGTGGKVGGGISASYAHTWGGSDGTIASTVKTITASANVPPSTFNVLWQLNYTAYLRRQDGTYVGTIGSNSQLNGYSLAMGTNNYSIESVPFAEQAA